MRLTLKDIFEIETAEIFNPDEFKPVKKVFIDSRKITKNSMFVAIKGQNFDGHDFVKEAVNKGAGVVVINRRKLKYFDDINVPIVTVKNTLTAYGSIARIWRRKLNPTVISITGSNGKTTTKEILATLLSERFKVTKSEGNNNNQIGVPLTILSANDKTEVLVLEHGTNHFGEIEYTAKIAEPDYAAITNIGDSHIQYLRNRSGVFKEKAALLNVTENLGGTIFINTDDKFLASKKHKYVNAVCYGFDGAPHVKGSIVGFTKDGKSKINIKGFGKNISTVLPLLGNSNALNYVAAVTIALKLGLTKKEIIAGTRRIEPVKGRLNLVLKNGFAIIDDTYNSNPQSVKEALDVLGRIKLYKNKIVVFGDMLELGEKSVEFHKKIKTQIRKLRPELVLTIGKYMKFLNGELTKTGINAKHFRMRKSLEKYLEKLDVSNSIILFKGSRGMRMEEFAGKLIEREA